MTLLRTLLIDNYDSYTYNLFQLIAEVNGALPTVLRNDEISWPSLSARIKAGEYHNIVISPGPGTPQRPADIGVSIQLLHSQQPIPILGVCLGFQALALAHGGAVCHAPEPVHGRLSSVEHSGHPLFQSIPSGPDYAVVRYHSLLVREDSLPPCLEAIAWTCGQHHALQLGATAGTADSARQNASDEGGQQPGLQHAGASRLLMAVAHRSLPHLGVQFHPESIATAYGPALLRNFAAMTCQHYGLPPPLPPAALLARLEGPPGSPMPPRPWDQQPGNLRLRYRHLPNMLHACGGSEALFQYLHGPDSGWQPGGGVSGAGANTWWLDSATTDRGRFSFMGGPGGGLWRRFEYRLPCPRGSSPLVDTIGQPTANGDSRQPINGQREGCEGNPTGAPPLGLLTITAADGQQRVLHTDFFTWLQGLLDTHRCRVCPQDAAALPFNFWGGLVGYLGYELKAECGGRPAHASPTPDAAFFLADQLVAVDHLAGDVYVLALSPEASPEGQQQAEAWVAHTAQQIQQLATDSPADQQPPLLQQEQRNGRAPLLARPRGRGCEGHQAAELAPMRGAAEQPPAGKQEAGLQLPPRFQLREGRRQYLENIAGCMQALHDGESYEVCLTTMLRRRGAPNPWHLYRTLRRINPAPYAAWLRYGAGDLQLCCCSPERFLRGDRGGTLEAKPIKGTAPRSADPEQDRRAAAELEASEKDRAENLMIVDLLRNDLGRVCVPGSVHVPGLMRIESYATVHQMVSTVRGLRRPGASIVDCLRAAFPGGSMTGAPKIRTMDIIDGLEGGARGVYSGSLGYLSFNDTFDLNIVIRTAVITPSADGGGQDISIGAGGAIVVQSDPAAEYEEMRLKARALLRAIGACDASNGQPATVHGDAQQVA